MSALRTVLLILAAVLALPARAEPPVDSLRLYVFDCGRIVFDDLGAFADTGEYDGMPGELSAPCFLIRHPKGDLLWDAGLGDRIAQTPAGVETVPGVRAFVAHPLQAQLAAIGLRAQEVDYLAFSHFHWDHTGNAGLFDAATWLLSRREVQALDAQPTTSRMSLDNLAARARAKVELIDLDRDVFGDGSVRILRANGHTAGHQVLMLRLAKAGTVILSGDLFHTRENFEHGRMPAFNYSRGETLGAIDRVRRILDNTRGRLVIQHDRRDIDALPKAPAYLD